MTHAFQWGLLFTQHMGDKISMYRDLYIVSGQYMLALSLREWRRGAGSYLEYILAPWEYLNSQTILVVNTTVRLEWNEREEEKTNSW